MLTHNRMRRVDLVFKHLQMFGIIPPDKIMKNETPTFRWKMSRTLHLFWSFGLPSIMVFASVVFGLDAWINGIPQSQILINSFFIVAASFNACVALGIFLYFDELGHLVPIIFKLNRDFQTDEFLTAEDIEKLRKQGSISMKVIFMVELIMTANSIILGFHIFEKYDMFRRYYAVPMCFLLGLDPDSWHIFIFMAQYSLIVRLVHAYVFVLILWLTFYLETTTFLLEQLTKNPRISFPCIVQAYRTEQVIIGCLANSKVLYILFPACFCIAFVILVTTLFCSIKLYAVVGFGILSILISCFIGISFIVNIWFVEVGRLNDMSKEFIRVWEQKGIRDKSCHRYVKSFVPLNIRIGNFFDVNKGTLLAFFDQVTNTTIDLILQ